ncbi:hypothetical protein [Methylobacter sp. YRD-M1]|nr:hypothetical protein [Methylobacter sp. YRD-M1]
MDFHLPFAAQIRLELGEYFQHIQENLAGRGLRIERLFHDP